MRDILVYHDTKNESDDKDSYQMKKGDDHTL